jgi:CheY-like chemotaxis protein
MAKSGIATPPYLGRHRRNPTNPLKKKGQNRLFSGTVYVDIKMRKVPSLPSSNSGSSRALDLARVLLVHGDLAPRLALQTILQAGGYAVDVAASPAEALSKLDEGSYALVLSDTNVPRNVLAYARVKDYRPATAQVTSYEPSRKGRPAPGRHNLSIYTENLPNLLGEVAELIGVRASRRYRPLRTAAD